MKVVAFIPYWKAYKYSDESIREREEMNIGGHALIERSLIVLQELEEIDDIVVYSNEEHLIPLLQNYHCRFLNRSAELDNQGVSIELIVQSFIDEVDADLYVLVHPRCPFIKSATVQKCIESVMHESYDSAFVGTQIQKFAWYKGQALNYSNDSGATVNLSELSPVIFESSAVYVFSKKSFMANGSRIGKAPYICIVDKFEGFDVESRQDYEIADLIINAGLLDQ